MDHLVIPEQRVKRSKQHFRLFSNYLFKIIFPKVQMCMLVFEEGEEKEETKRTFSHFPTFKKLIANIQVLVIQSRSFMHSHGKKKIQSGNQFHLWSLYSVFSLTFFCRTFFYIALILGKMQGEKLSFWAVKLDPHFHEIMAHRKIMRR